MTAASPSFTMSPTAKSNSTAPSSQSLARTASSTSTAPAATSTATAPQQQQQQQQDAPKKVKKKKSNKKPQLDGINTAHPGASTSSLNSKIPPSPAVSTASSKSKDGGASGSTGSLIICRNKHWRYISSFHGPWLQLPPEVLESLAYHNWATPRPHPIDPAVFFDIVKIRRLVDDATTISVRAASGIPSSTSSFNSSAASLMGGGNAAILGIGFGNNHAPTAKLSRERKHRMRELATQKLSRAYALDEIAASVATMQGASTLEDVASFVLARNPEDVDAKYVHFFHEKIPSRMLAASTSLEPLDQVIFERPFEGWCLRTRAVTRGFKEDYVGAAADLTSALKKVRSRVGQQHDDGTATGMMMGMSLNGGHTFSGSNGLGGSNGAGANRGSRGTGSGSGGGPGVNGSASPHGMDGVNGSATNGTGTWDGVTKDEALQPSSLEMQLLFHRASTYLTVACQKIEAFNALLAAEAKNSSSSPTSMTTAEMVAAQNAAIKKDTMRKAIRANSKKAIRDYLKYLSHFDYTPGLTPEEVEEQLRASVQAATRAKTQKAIDQDGGSNGTATNGATTNGNGNYSKARIPAPRGPVYAVSTLFTSPPATLPPYPPPASTELTKYGSTPAPQPPAAANLLPAYESVTYHPLITDALHSLLLCHAIISTPSKELQRYAFMVSRLARICDGYPIFLAARSPARADWIELIRRCGDWMSLGRSWESLCQPAPLPPVFSSGSSAGSSSAGGFPGDDGYYPHQHHHGHRGGDVGGAKGENISSDALSALMNHGNDEDALTSSPGGSFYDGYGGDIYGGGSRYRNGGGGGDHGQVRGAKRWAQEDGKEYPISTERAAVIARFVKEEMKREKERAKLVAEAAAAAAASTLTVGDGVSAGPSAGGEAGGLKVPVSREESFATTEEEVD